MAGLKGMFASAGFEQDASVGMDVAVLVLLGTLRAMPFAWSVVTAHALDEDAQP
jgi:hypothetical protein